MKSKSVLIVLVVFYSILMLSFLSWGVPNLSHPFTYHMDEWHQLMAVRGVFTQGSANIPGSAHGPMLQFFLSGIFLGPFYLLHIVDPFSITSSLSNLDAQGRLFEVLRFNSLLFGIGSMVIIWFIAKKYFKTNSFLTTVFFTFTPIWIMLSNYFKYDIALIFWLLTTLFVLFWYQKSTNKKVFYLAGFLGGLTLATKISALPLIPLFVFAYFLFTKKSRRKIREVILGTSIFIGTFIFVGIPDVFFRTADYYEYFYSNLVSTPQMNTIIDYGASPFVYLFTAIYPLLFGHVFFVLSIGSFLYVVYSISLHIRKKQTAKVATEIFLVVGFLLFLFSLLPLRVSASGNRSLVLLPFFALFVGIATQKILQNYAGFKKMMIIFFLFLCVVAQIFEVFIWSSLKWRVDQRTVSSVWIAQNISSRTTIGIENIPIYQYIPDVLLKEFYQTQQKGKIKTQYRYKVIGMQDTKLPRIIVLSNVYLETNYYSDSPKKQLVKRLQKEGYREQMLFDIPSYYYFYFGNKRELYTTGLVPLAPISIFTKK